MGGGGGGGGKKIVYMLKMGGGGQKDHPDAENGGGGGGGKIAAYTYWLPQGKRSSTCWKLGLQIGTQQDLNKMVDMVKFLGQKDRPDAENGGKTAAQTYRLSKRECPHPVNIPVSIGTRSGTVQRW